MRDQDAAGRRRLVAQKPSAASCQGLRTCVDVCVCVCSCQDDDVCELDRAVLCTHPCRTRLAARQTETLGTEENKLS